MYTIDDLIVIYPQESLNFTESIHLRNYNFSGEGNYTIHATYGVNKKAIVSNEHPPIWEGTIYSKQLEFHLYYNRR